MSHEAQALVSVLVGLNIDHDDLPGAELLVQKLLRQHVLDLTLNGSTQRTSAHGRVVTDVGQPMLGIDGELHTNSLAFELVHRALDHQVDDLGDLGPAELMEDDGLVNTVQELRPEVNLQRLVDLFLHALIGHGLVVLGEAESGFTKILGTQVGGHDQHGVAEIDRASLRVGQATLLQNLEQSIEHVGVGLFDLVEEHHREGFAADRFGQLAALLVAHVAGR